MPTPETPARRRALRRETVRSLVFTTGGYEQLPIGTFHDAGCTIRFFNGYYLISFADGSTLDLSTERDEEHRLIALIPSRAELDALAVE